MAQSAIYNLDVYQPGSLKASAYLKSVVLLYDAVPFAGTSGYSRFEKTKRLNKSGIFKFEADVHFLDPAVKLGGYPSYFCLSHYSKNHVQQPITHILEKQRQWYQSNSQ